MNLENQKFLEDRLFYLGTEKRLFADLAKNLSEDKPQFSLLYTNHHDKDKFDAKLLFRKSDTSDMYFLNRYDATLQKPGQEGKSQTFYLENGKGITMKEAFNLMDGRAVKKELTNKEGIKYDAWVKLDFNNRDEKGNSKMLQYNKRYGFDLHSQLFKLPLMAMNGESFNQLAASLERGNLQSVRIDRGAGSENISVAANPQFKTLDMFDDRGLPMSKFEKFELYEIAEKRKTDFDKGISNAPDHVQGSAIQASSTPEKGEEKVLVNEQKSDYTVNDKKTEPSGEKVSSNEQKPEHAVNEKKSEKVEKVEDKVPLKGAKKEKLASLLPKKNTDHKRGLAI